MTSLRTRLAIATMSGVLALSTAEAMLRIIGFQFSIAPIVQFGWPDPTALKKYYRPDPELLWVSPGYQDKLAASRRAHPAIVFMGDSCTEFGTYPARTLALLGTTDPELATGVTLGVGGWSSEQGLAQLRRDVLPLRPKVVTIYYGWNDHWVALGPTDADLTLAHRLSWFAEHLRLAQLILKARMGLSGDLASRPNRVPIARYRSNLASLIQEARKANITPVLITAPSNQVRGREPEYLAERHVRTLAEVVPLHDEYLAATRAVAHGENATLCDIADKFSTLPEPRDRYFRPDGIHLLEAGDGELATMLASCIRKAVGQ